MILIKKRPLSIVAWVSCLFCFCISSLLISGCTPKAGVETDFSRKGEVTLSKIAVVPFQMVIPEDNSASTVRCPLSGTIFRTCESAEGAETVVGKIFFRKLKDCRRFALIPTDRVGGIYKRISAGSLKATPLEILRKVGKELGADGVVAGYVYRYSERKGYPYSAEKPASVAFGIYLVRVSDGTLVWRGIFDRTQRSLLENILRVSSFLRQGGRWITAERLSEVGVDEIFRAFPGLREGED